MFKLKQVLLLVALSVALAVYAQGPNGTGTYYKGADGFSGKTLKTKLYHIVGKLHTTDCGKLTKQQISVQMANCGICILK